MRGTPLFEEGRPGFSPTRGRAARCGPALPEHRQRPTLKLYSYDPQESGVAPLGDREPTNETVMALLVEQAHKYSPLGLMQMPYVRDGKTVVEGIYSVYHGEPAQYFYLFSPAAMTAREVENFLADDLHDEDEDEDEEEEDEEEEEEDEDEDEYEE